MKRREFLKLSVNIGALSFLQLTGFGCTDKEKKVEVLLPALPYAEDALVPTISVKTVYLHYGKHHQGYVNKLNKLIAGTKKEGMPLENIIEQSKGKADQKVIFNNAAQVYNHNFYWHSMIAKGGGAPQGKIAERIKADFGSYANFSDAFLTAALSQFGSGWVWLVEKKDRLSIMKTSNADTPVAHSIKPILTLDLWEHAYYLDYQNRREDYVKAYLNHLVNWHFAESNLVSSK